MIKKCPICGFALDSSSFKENEVFVCPNCGFKNQNGELNHQGEVQRISSKEVQDEFAELLELAENGRKNQHGYLTYKEVPYLKKMAELYKNSNMQTEKEIVFGTSVLRYLSHNYKKMDQIGNSIKFDKLILENDRLLLKFFKSEKHIKQTKLDITTATRNRNYYFDDKCYDLINLFDGIFKKDEIKSMLEEAPNHKHTDINYDPVELTDAYLAVIDEVEEIIDKAEIFDGLGACHFIWGIKKRELANRGIEWNSPEDMNPRILFD